MNKKRILSILMLGSLAGSTINVQTGWFLDAFKDDTPKVMKIFKMISKEFKIAKDFLPNKIRSVVWASLGIAIGTYIFATMIEKPWSKITEIGSSTKSKILYMLYNKRIQAILNDEKALDKMLTKVFVKKLSLNKAEQVALILITFGKQKGAKGPELEELRKQAMSTTLDKDEQEQYLFLALAQLKELNKNKDKETKEQEQTEAEAN